MSSARRDLDPHHKPTPDDLAGTPACKEEDLPMIHARVQRSTKVRERGLNSARPAPPTDGPPTADDLAGIPVSAEGKEDLTRGRRKSDQQ
jgi:hypothetical protein